MAAEWDYEKNDPLTPEMVTRRDTRPVGWICKNGHTWTASISYRFRKKASCPYCSGVKLWRTFNDLQTINPDLAKEWHPTKNGNMKPIDVMPNHNGKVWWKCSKCGHEWQASPNSRSNKAHQRGCKECYLRSIHFSKARREAISEK